MSDLYGYNSALSQGQSFNARVKNFNDGVLVANQRAQDKYDAEVKAQPGKLSDDKTKEHEDEAYYGFTDGTGAAGTAYGLITDLSQIKEKGLTSFAVDQTKDRLNTIQNTFNKLGSKGEKPPAADMTPSNETTAAGTTATDAEAATGAAEDAGNNVASAGSETLQGGENALGAGAAAAEREGGQIAADEIESSGLKTAIIKGTLNKVLPGAGKVLGDAGLTAVSEIGGKALGDFGGISHFATGISNVISGCGTFFQGESTGDKLQELGAGLDLVGTIAPPLELVGGAVSLVGGIMDAVEDFKNDSKQQDKDATKPTPPKLTATKVTPAFTSMGLAASAPISAKQSITGSSSF
jgi:hypothetical protein